MLFAAFVAISVYAQTLTGFALGMILLGLVAVTNLVPLPDAANAVNVLMIVNALTFFYPRKIARIEKAIIPAVCASLLGTLAGIAILTFLAANAYQTLRAIFGISIVVCAILLWKAAKPFATTSGIGYFTVVGSLSGVLGGMFSASGPPLVYAIYRQPWSLECMQDSLIFSFALGAALRLIIVAVSGNFSKYALVLASEAIPVTLLVTALSARRRSPFSTATMKRIVCVLLVCSGLGTLFSGLHGVIY